MVYNIILRELDNTLKLLCLSIREASNIWNENEWVAFVSLCQQISDIHDLELEAIEVLLFYLLNWLEASSQNNIFFFSFPFSLRVGLKWCCKLRRGGVGWAQKSNVEIIFFFGVSFGRPIKHFNCYSPFLAQKRVHSRDWTIIILN